MARTIRQTPLHNRSRRLELAPHRYHFTPLGVEKQALAYRRGKKTSSWFVRYLDPKSDRYRMEKIGTADDYQDAGGEVIDYYTAFKLAQAAAAVAIESARKRQRRGRPTKQRNTVDQALDDYLKWAKMNRKSHDRIKASADALIRPELGDIPLDRLTLDDIRSWHHRLARSPKRQRGKVTKAKPYEEWTDDQKRARKATANRVLTILKAALNQAWERGKVEDPNPWRRVKAFKGVDKPRISYLSESEAQRLINAANAEFRPIVQGALLTGCRYGELSALTVADYDPDARGLHLKDTKSSKPRFVPLTRQGDKFIAGECGGKKPEDRIFTRKNGSAWGKSHQTRFMAETCARAKIRRVGFHALRHTFATMLLRARDGRPGVSIRFVAEALGNSVRICEKHYGHVASEDLRSELERGLPQFDLAVQDVISIH